MQLWYVVWYYSSLFNSCFHTELIITTFVIAPIFQELNSKIYFSMYTNGPFLSNATSVAYEGAALTASLSHNDCRKVPRSCCFSIEWSYRYHKLSPNVFQRIWWYIHPAQQPQTSCNRDQELHVQPLYLQRALRPVTRTDVCKTKEFLHNLSETFWGKLVWMLVVLIAVSTRLHRHPTRWRLAPRGDLHGFHGTGQMVSSVHGIGDASHQLLTGFLTPPPNPININPVFPCDALPLKRSGQDRADPHGEDECRICLTLTGCRWCVEGDLRAVGAEHGVPAASNSEGIQTVRV